MEPNQEQTKELHAAEESASDRRDVLQKLGRFAAYAAPFTVLALSQKAEAGTGRGPIRH